MDKALKLIIRYILYTLVGSLVGTIFYLMYFQVMQYVPEGISQKISMVDFLRTFFKVLSYSVFVVPALIINHKLKRKGTGLQCLFYILLSVLSWGLLLPFSYKMYDKFQQKYVAEERYNPLSKNEFRQYKDKVYYFSDNYNPDSTTESHVSTVIIDTSPNGVVVVDKILESNEFELIKAANPYRDLLVKNSFTNNKILSNISADLLLEKLASAMDKGITFILGFMTLGFVICAIYGLANVSSWRLINSSIVIFMTAIVLGFNCIYYGPAGSFIRESSIAKNQLFDYLSQFVDEPFLCIMNLVLGFIFIVIGIVRFVVSYNASKSANKGV